MRQDILNISVDRGGVWGRSCWEKKRPLRLWMIGFPFDLLAYSGERHTCVDTMHAYLAENKKNDHCVYRWLRFLLIYMHILVKCIHVWIRHTAHCSTLQHTTTHHNTLQHTAAHCSTLQHTAIHCNMCGCPFNAG